MKGLVFLFLIFLLALPGFAQSTYSGNVLDSFDKKYLEGVSVSIKGKETTLTNSRGYFSIKGMVGDTLLLSFPGFFDHQLILNTDRFLLLQIQDRARLLPTFQVDAEPYRFRFKDGKLFLSENETEEEKSIYQKVSAGLGTPDGGGGVTIYGPISYFSKRNTQLRRYAEQLEHIRRRAGYLEVIDSDSIRTELMSNYQLDRDQWDQLIVRFNQFHIQHEFLDWSSERVHNSLSEFIRLEAVFEN